jgi:hypothetical protein
MRIRSHASQTEISPPLLRTWALMGAELLPSQSRDVPNWDSVRRMIDAASERFAEDGERLRYLLDESRRRLAPLADPFDIDLGLHRWLEAEREEAYSDWLEWILRQLPCAENVFELFNLDPPEAVLECRQWNVQRELRVSHGHPDHEGRLDLVIRFADLVIIVVEVKKGDADDADTTKHCGYSLSIDEQKYRYKYPVLLAASAEEDDYDGFSFCSWATVCVEMRRQAISICKQGRVTTAAMVVAFVAAVEQNLLGFSPSLVQHICMGPARSFNVEVVAHLEAFLKRLET